MNSSEKDLVMRDAFLLVTLLYKWGLNWEKLPLKLNLKIKSHLFSSFITQSFGFKENLRDLREERLK